MPKPGRASVLREPGLTPGTGSRLYLRKIRLMTVILEPVTYPSTRSRGHGQRVLIVDDETINLQVLVNHLSTQHYVVTQAQSGIEALELINQGAEFDLVVLGRYDAPHVRLRSLPEACVTAISLHDLPVIMLTAKDQVSDLLAGFDAGANDYLTKPFSRDELLTRIRNHIQLTQDKPSHSDGSCRLSISTFCKGKASSDIHLGDPHQ